MHGNEVVMLLNVLSKNKIHPGIQVSWLNPGNRLNTNSLTAWFGFVVL